MARKHDFIGRCLAATCYGRGDAVKEGRVQAAYEQHQARIRTLNENEG